MAGIILIIILAFIAFCAGDSSGIEAIGKIIIYGALIIFMLYVCAIIIEIPVLSFIFAIGVFTFLLYKFIHRNDNSNSLKSNSSDIKNDVVESNEKVISSSEIVENKIIQSDFQKELEQNTKTPEKIADEKWVTEKGIILQTAERDYNYIKNELLKKAQNGEYVKMNQHKHIFYKFESSYLLNCIYRQYTRNPTGRIGSSSYRTNEKVYYHINKTKQYDLYLSTVLEYASNDNINIEPFFAERDVIYNRENSITLPYTYTHQYGIGVSTHKIKAYLKCSIEY